MPSAPQNGRKLAQHHPGATIFRIWLSLGTCELHFQRAHFTECLFHASYHHHLLISVYLYSNLWAKTWEFYDSYLKYIYKNIQAKWFFIFQALSNKRRCLINFFFPLTFSESWAVKGNIVLNDKTTLMELTRTTLCLWVCDSDKISIRRHTLSTPLLIQIALVFVLSVDCKHRERISNWMFFDVLFPICLFSPVLACFV